MGLGRAHTGVDPPRQAGPGGLGAQLLPHPPQGWADLRLSPGPLGIHSTLPGPNGTRGGQPRRRSSHLRPVASAQSRRLVPQDRKAPRPLPAGALGQACRRGFAHSEPSSQIGTTLAPQPMGVRGRGTGPDSLRTFATPPAQSGHTKRSRRTSLSPARQAQSRPPFCRLGRSGRSEGTWSEIFDRSPRQAPQGSEGHEDVWHGVLRSARPR
ncbi:hypothetical protein NDU88_005821 [Pleurodeles waltl]|uniref:Uncharacterized protein n=1 Tax=Pleurodeles waltl TaxID=8319 RepID=A0AAV7WVS3_PLEWA|nr:hypothetical protein NDU88_005821 [Pleurodeles waltl]